ncbi:MAG: hypothetical protein Q6373_006975 [Candidatus Sigynarchaeota archaeon]
MSITDLLAAKGVHALLARAATAYGTMGITGADLQRCIEYTIRYGLGSIRLPNENAPADLYRAIAHVARHQVADLLAGNAKGTSTKRHDLVRASTVTTASTAATYWVDKVCEVLGIDIWLDDSLDKWFLDTHHPLADVIVQACRRRVMDYIATCAIGSITPNHDDLVIDIVHDLQARFPALTRFSRHLPRAIAATIEQDVLGIPLVDKAEHVMPAMAAATESIGVAPRVTRPGYSTAYPDPSQAINMNNPPNTTNDNMRPIYP